MAKTDGVPLFVEELTKMVLESGLLQEREERYELTGPAAPAGDSRHAPGLAHGAAGSPRRGEERWRNWGRRWGASFPTSCCRPSRPWTRRPLQRGLQQLVEAEFLYQRGRAAPGDLHVQACAHPGRGLSVVAPEHPPAVPSAHCPGVGSPVPGDRRDATRAGGPALHRRRADEQAIRYWQRAGQRASDRSAHLEAISHVTTGIELLQTLPETPAHTQQALTLHIALGAALQLVQGMAAPEVEHAYSRARELSQQVGETPEIIPVLYGLWRFYVVRSQFHTAHEVGDTLLRLAQQVHDPALSVLAHYALGVTWFFLGALPAARQHLEAGIARYTPDQRRTPVVRMGQDPGVACRVHAAQTLWLLGYPAQALARLHEALALAQELSHPPSLAFARCLAALVSQWRRDVPAVHEHAEACVALATAQGFPQWAAWGTSLRGWALAMQGQGEAGLSQLRQGIAACQATGTALYVQYNCTMLADVCNHLGHTADGLQALAEVHALVEQQEERLWDAETCRLQGVLLLRQPGTPQAEAEAWFQRALDVARRQEAKALELRAAMSLARLWQQQGKQAEAHELLAPVYGWFTEGFDTADLQEARALLEELAG